MGIIVPPIKSQGIKTKLVDWILEIADGWDGRWIEPFLGTGVVAFNARPKKAILNDINPHIIKFYKSVQDGEIDHRKVKEYLHYEGKLLSSAADDGYAHYRYVKDRFNESFNPLDFLFLSRAGFNGMIRFNKKGYWNIPFCKKPNRFSQAYITKIVNQVKAIELIIQPSWEFRCERFENIIKLARQGDMVYCDPPYFGRYTDYYNNWTEDDESKLASLLSKTKARFVLSTWHHNSYRSNESVAKYWSTFNVSTKNHFYHSGGKIENRNSIVEALIYNFPSKVKNKTEKNKSNENEQSLIFAAINH